MKLDNYQFKELGEIIPCKNNKGKIIGYNNSKDYQNKKNLKLNKYGNKTFCDFEIGINCNLPKTSGVYAIFSHAHNTKRTLLYVGRAKNLASRWSKTNYAHISPRNCFAGGQSTNCHINSSIYDQTVKGNRLYLYFYETHSYKEVEDEIIKKLNPPLNIQLKSKG